MNIDISLIFGDAARWIMPVLALLVAAFCVPLCSMAIRRSASPDILSTRRTATACRCPATKCQSGAARRAISSSDITPSRAFTPCFQSIRTAGA